jgi:hypothetical protein
VVNLETAFPRGVLNLVICDTTFPGKVLVKASLGKKGADATERVRAWLVGDVD